MLIHNADITGSLTINGIPYNTGSFSGSFIAGTNIMSANTVSLTGSFTGSFFGDGSQLSGVTSYTNADTLSFIQGYSGSYSGSFFGDGSNLTGVTSYTDADTLAFINSLDVVSGSIQTVSTVSDTFTSVTSYTVTHNFGTKEVIVSVYENDTLIFPSSINTPTVNTVTITFPEPVTGRVVVVKAGHIVSGSINYNSVLNKPTLVSGSSQISFTGITNKPTLVSGSSQITYSGLTGIPSGILSGSAQIAAFGYATTGSNQFSGSQTITGSLTVTGQVVAQTLNVQQVTSSVVYSSGSNVFGNELGNTQQFTGSVGVTGSLTVAGAGSFSSTLATEGNITVTANSAAVRVTESGGADVRMVAGGSSGFFGTYSNHPLQFLTDSVTKMTLNSSGNLGLGVTPSAWNSAYRAIQFGTTGAIFGESGDAANYFTTNTFVDSVGFKYITSDWALGYFQENGVHSWRNAPSGTAGQPISFTPAMTLNASGNLSIGNTNNTYKLDVSGQIKSTQYLIAPDGTNNVYHLVDATSTYAGLYTIQAGGGSSGYGGSISLFGHSHATKPGYVNIGISASSNGKFTVTNQANASGTEIFVVQQNGNVGIGTASPSANLYVVRANDGGSGTPGVILRTDNGANDIVRFQDGTTIVAVVKNDGSIGIGTPTPTNKLHLTGASSTPSLRLGSTSVGFHWDIGRENQSTGDFVFNSTNVSTGTTEKMRITQDSVAYLRMASGTGGIQFNGDTAASNALDDYEEGTWTPTSVSGGLTLSIQVARYTKVGRLVTAQCYVSMATGGNSAGVVIGGLPFTNLSNGWAPGALDVSACSRIGGVARVAQNSTEIGLIVSSGSTSLPRFEIQGNEFGNDSYIILTVTYQTS